MKLIQSIEDKWTCQSILMNYSDLEKMQDFIPASKSELFENSHKSENIHDEELLLNATSNE